MKTINKMIQLVVGKKDIYDINTNNEIDYDNNLPKEEILEIKDNLTVKQIGKNIVIEIFKREITIEEVLKTKEEMINVGLKILKKYTQNEYYETYTVYIIKEYTLTDQWFKENKFLVAKLLRNQKERVPKYYVEKLEENIIKYSEKDIMLIEWDNCLILDRDEDIDEEIKIICLQCIKLLNLRIFDKIISEKIKEFLSNPPKIWDYISLYNISKEIYQSRLKYLAYLDSIENKFIFYGEPYHIELYLLLSKKFYISKWIQRIEKKLDMLEDLYEMINTKMNEFYSIILEITIIILILIEIIMSLFHIGG